MLTKQDYNQIILLNDDLLDEIGRFKKALAPYHQLVDQDGERYYTRFDYINDRGLIEIWHNIADTFFNIIDLDKRNKYNNWSDYILEVHDIFVEHYRSKDVWVVTAESIVYDRLPKALKEIQNIIRESEYNTQLELM